MARRWHQLSLKFLIGIVIVVAAYLAGRMSAIEDSNHAEEQREQAEARCVGIQQFADFWRGVALGSRHDLANGIVRAEMIRAGKLGIGGSWPSAEVDAVTRPHWHRWRIKFSEDRKEYASQLDALGIQLAALWHNDSRIQVVSGLSSNLTITSFETPPKGSLILDGTYLDYDLLAQRGIEGPTLVVKILPENLRLTLARRELRFASIDGARISDIEMTYFVIRSKDGRNEVVVETQLHNSNISSGKRE